MKYNFDESFSLVVGHEGGFTNDKRDRGNWTSGVIGTGVLRGTKFGISAMSYPTIDIKALTEEAAKAIYLKDFWDLCKCGMLPDGIDYLVFDAAVNHGKATSIKLLQTALNIPADGLIGPKTLEAVAYANPVLLAADFAVARMQFYTEIVTFPTYGKGWAKRCVETLASALRIKPKPAVDQSNVEPEVAPVPKKKATVLSILMGSF